MYSENYPDMVSKKFRFLEYILNVNSVHRAYHLDGDGRRHRQDGLLPSAAPNRNLDGPYNGPCVYSQYHEISAGYIPELDDVHEYGDIYRRLRFQSLWFYDVPRCHVTGNPRRYRHLTFDVAVVDA